MHPLLSLVMAAILAYFHVPIHQAFTQGNKHVSIYIYVSLLIMSNT